MERDEAVRDFLMRPAAKPMRICLFLLLALCQFVLCLRKHFLLSESAADQVWISLLFLLPLLVMLLFLFRFNREASPLTIVLGGAVCLMAMMMRLCFIDRSSGDFEIYLADWLRVFGGQSFRENMQMQVGEYHVLYQYILFLISRISLPQLYMVKAVSFLGDAFLLGAGFALYRIQKKEGVLPLLLLLVPSAVLNGGMFAQCDSLYTAALLWGLALCLRGRSFGGFACFGLAFCFKLQAVFLYPLLPVLWCACKCRLRDLAGFLLAILLVQVPALIGGKTAGGLLSVYVQQTGLYTGLNYGAPNLWAILETAGLDGYAYGTFGISLALGLCFLLDAAVIPGIRRQEEGVWLHLAAVIVMLVVFFLPRMHERYVYPAEMLFVLTALCDRWMIPAAVMAALASLLSLLEGFLPLWCCALMMLAAMTLGMIRLCRILERAGGEQ